MRLDTVILLVASALSLNSYGQSMLRVNQAGYRTDDFKAAVYIGPVDSGALQFELLSPEAGAGAIDSVVVYDAWAPAQASARIYFTGVTTPGQYTLSAREKATGKIVDVSMVYIGDDAYSRFDLKELPLNYLRQQRCGYNPVHNSKCHLHDGYVVLSDSLDGRHYDVTGGWHDASDYLQYLPTSAHTVYQLLFAYRQNPKNWADRYDAYGKSGSNGVPDILDEARWGLEWMLKMNPQDDLYFNQIADDRDHKFVGLPQVDSVDYGYGPGAGRPVYPVSGKPYGLQKYKNRSTGEASSLGKFASSFGLGAEVFAGLDSAFSASLSVRAQKAYERGVANPGASQTAPCSSPYFYEEDNWVDDMELAAAVLGRLDEAAHYGRMEPITPWMGADTARHYQWYPFINLGHFELAREHGGKYSNEFKQFMRSGVEEVASRGADNVFKAGVPFVWCSNNLTVGFVTQAMLYRELTGDNSFIEAESAARDWLFGVNPWGQTMIIMPEETVSSSPQDPHSAMTDRTVARQPGRDWLVGGLVDGPVYTTIFNNLWGVHLRRPDRFAAFQGPEVVYHDDYSDYSTNEPTMDGTASMAFFLSRLCR